MSTPIAVVSSDWHFHKFNNFNENNNRLQQTADAVNHILRVAESHKVPLLVPGDFVHRPESIDNDVLYFLMVTLFHNRGVPIYGISGNHDMPQRNNRNHESMSYMKTLSILGLIKHAGHGHDLGKFYLYGFDYHDNDKDLIESIKKFESTDIFKSQKKKKVLLLHSDVPGATTPSGISLGEAKHFPTHVDSLFEKWDLVLFGHIHKPQKISSKCYMIGSPIQQISSDEGTKMGYWILYSDFKMKFIPLNDKFPEFITLKKGEKPTNKKDYFIPYDEVEDLKNSEANGTESNFSTRLTRKQLAKRYCRQNGIRNKEKIKALINILMSQE